MNEDGNENSSKEEGVAVEADDSKKGKKHKSVVFPGVPLRRCVELASRLESKWGTARLLRTDAAADLGYAGLTGTATKTMTALIYFGLIESAGRGYVQVSQQASRLLRPADIAERNEALRLSCFRPALFSAIRERFDGVDLPPQDGIANFLIQGNYDPKYVVPAARQYLEAVRYVQETVGAADLWAKSRQQDPKATPLPDNRETLPADDPPPSLTLVLKGVGDVSISLNIGTGVLDEDTQRTLLRYLKANLDLLDAVSSGSEDTGSNRDD